MPRAPEDIRQGSSSRKVNQELPDGKAREYTYRQGKETLLWISDGMFATYPFSKRFILWQLSCTYPAMMQRALMWQVPCFSVL